VSVPLLLGALVAVLCVFFVASPFLRQRADEALVESGAAEERRLALAEERDRALAALKELEFDHRTGKVADDDYRAQVGALRRSAADALRALDAADGAAPVYGRGDASPRAEEIPVSEPQSIEPSIPEPSPVPSEMPVPPTIPEPTPPPSEPPAPVPVPEPSPEPSPPAPE
jgi:hypothetical protein